MPGLRFIDFPSVARRVPRLGLAFFVSVVSATGVISTFAQTNTPPALDFPTPANPLYRPGPAAIPPPASGVAAPVPIITAPPGPRVPAVSPLATAPDWSKLEAYQETITRAEFERVMHQIYTPDGAFWKFAMVTPEQVTIYATPEKIEPPLFVLRFAKDEASAKPVPVIFRPEKAAGISFSSMAPSVASANKSDTASATKSAPGVAGSTGKAKAKKSTATASTEGSPRGPLPLAGVRIVLDPGHIGGAYAKVEERWFRLHNDPPVIEGDLSYLTCQRIERQLVAAGAQIFWTKKAGEPATAQRPAALMKLAGDLLTATTIPGIPAPTSMPGGAQFIKLVKEKAEQLFYRQAEIRARAKIIAEVKPDLTICMHYNASAWGDEYHPMLVDGDRLVVFVNGAYAAEELQWDDEKFEMLQRVLMRTNHLEMIVSDRVATCMAASFRLPPETYETWGTVKQVGPNPYVFARNLLANRIFRGPVVYVEGPYMNSPHSYPRFIEGDYEGERVINGVSYPSIPHEAADAVVTGVLAYFEGKPNPVLPPSFGPLRNFPAPVRWWRPAWLTE